MFKLKRSALCLGIAALCLGNNVTGQEETPFTEIIEMKRSGLEAQGLDEETVNKRMAKFIYYWQDRLTTTGTQGYIDGSFYAGGEGERSVGFCGTDPASWEVVGPKEYTGAPVAGGGSGIATKQWLGLMEEIYAAPDLSYYLAASARGGIWKRGASDTGWRNVTDDLNVPFFKITSFAADPFDSDHIYATSGGDNYKGEGILESTDGGETWSRLLTLNTAYCASLPAHYCSGGNDKFLNVEKLIIDPHASASSATLHLYAIVNKDATANGVWKSTDAGATWTNLSAPTLPGYSFYNDLEVDDQGNLFCTSIARYSENAQYFKYDNSSSTWSDLTSNIISAGYTSKRMKLTVPDGAKIYVLSDQNNGRKLKVSTDRGATWTTISSRSNSDFYHGPGPKIEVEYDSAQNLVFTGAVHFAKVDGTTGVYTNIYQGHVDLRDIFLHNGTGSLKVFTANDGGVSEVDYVAKTYADLNGDNLPVLEFYDIGTANSSGDRYLGGVAHNHGFKLDNGNWTKIGGGDGNAAVINYDDPNIGYVTFGAGVFGFDFSSGIYYLTGTGAPIGPSSQFFHYLELHPTNPDTLLHGKGRESVVATNYLNKWCESTNTWVNEVVPYVKTMGEIAVSKSSPNVYYIADGFTFTDTTHTGKLVKSTNYGKTGTWTSIGGGPIYDITGSTYLDDLNDVLAWSRITDIEVNPYNPDVLWISISGYWYTDEEYRVLKSEDGGATWLEYSAGLPRYPVNSLVRAEGSGVLFVGTEAGVFYRTGTMTQWECFNTGMPYAVINDLDVNNCTNELVASTLGRGIWKTPIPGDLTTYEYSGNTTIYSGSTFNFNADVIIKAPATFTVNGTLEMGKGTKIVVEPGASLVIDGGTITRKCDQLWEGIYVAGTPGYSQLDDTNPIDPNHGTVVVKNNATIEYAREAIFTSYGDGLSDHGGRIFAENSTFSNNRFGIGIMSFPGDNVGYVRNCRFETTGQIAANYVDENNRPLGTATHIRIWDADYVELTDNVFENTGTFDQDLRGLGISVYDADLIVAGDGVLSFKGLSKGIAYNSISGAHYLSVDNNVFDNVVQGVTINGGTDLDLDNNQFLNYQGSTTYAGLDYMQSWGIQLEATQGATVTNNTFETTLTGIGDLNHFTRGIIGVGTGVSTTQVFHNTFGEGNMIGFLGWLDNTGVELTCNSFYSDYGIYIDRPESGVSKLSSQGNYSNPAANFFYKSCGGNEEHIYFDGVNPLMPNLPPNYDETNLEYYHYSGASLQPMCISNETTMLPYADVSNPAPGWVTPINTGITYSFNCSGGGGGGLPGEMGMVTDITVVAAKIKALEDEITYAKGLDPNQRITYLKDLNWIEETEQGGFVYGVKAQQLVEYRLVWKSLRKNYEEQLIGNVEADVFSDSEVLGLMDTAMVNTVLSKIINTESIELYELDGLLQKSNYPYLFELLVSLQEENRTYYDLKPSEMSTLERLAGEPSLEGMKASAILSFVKENTYQAYADRILSTESQPGQNKLITVTDGFEMYPNPANDEVRVLFDQENLNGSLIIYNSLGEVVQEDNITQNQLVVDVSEWDAGVYVVCLKTENDRFMRKLIVQQ